SLSKLCSMARLTNMQSSTVTPVSPSITTLILLSSEIDKSIKNKCCFSSRLSFNKFSTVVLNISWYKKRGLYVPSYHLILTTVQIYNFYMEKQCKYGDLLIE